MPRTTVPPTPSDIDPAWLTSALSARHPGVAVREVEILSVNEVTNTHLRVGVHYDRAAGAPERMFAKMLPLDPARREAIAASGMGPREARFYASLAPTLGLRVPETHVALFEDDGSFLVMMEDLTTTGCTVSDGTQGAPTDAAARALEELAALHVRFEDPRARQAEVPWVPVPATTSTYGSRLLRYGLDHHRDRLSDDFAAIAEIYIDRGDALQAFWREGRTTVIHGDPHIGNLFLDGDRIGFLDWGIINVGVPMRDVSYFLTMALGIEDRRRHERDLIAHYLQARAASGGSPISPAEAWRAHRLHAAYTVPASCQVVSFPADATPARRVFADAFLARAEAALADLGALDALHQEGL